jgi:hypothetical protein
VFVDNLRSPTLLPLLSRGKHRNPRKGACFMELASMLAGQSWSDRPACTHPLLAAVARHVNDCISDEGRQRLARLIPSVIGLTSDDLRVDARIALRCAAIALPVVSAERQCALAVGILTANRVLSELDGRPAPPDFRSAAAPAGPRVFLPDERSARALAEVPDAKRWAERYAADLTVSHKAFRQRSAPSITGCAVVGVSQACIPDPDSVLHELLAGAIDECREATVARHQEPVALPS